MWTYAQSTGELLKDGEFQGIGYSGASDGKNNPAMQAVPMVGPIPQGVYTIGPAYDDPHLGHVVMHLDPKPGTDTFGRSLFRMHGDSIAHPGHGSDGCIAIGPGVRETVAANPDRDLTVTA